MRDDVIAGTSVAHDHPPPIGRGATVPHRIEESVPQPYYTADMVRAMPDDGNRYELVYGELLVTPSPRLLHQLVVGRLTFGLTQYVDRYQIGHVFGVPADITWGRTDVLVQPDVFVAPLHEVRTLDWEQVRGLMLVAEVMSPSTVKHDRFTKRKRYQDARVPLYWIIDADRRDAELWTPDDLFPAIERERLVWHPAGAQEPFVLALGDLFRPV